MEFYIKKIFIMELNLLEYDIDSIKSILQGILDKHLPEGQQISVQEFDEQGIVWLIQLLLEKDDKKREQLWQEIEDKYQVASNDFRNTYQKILEICDQIKITEQLGTSLVELKSNIKNDHSLSQLEQEIWL